MSCNPAVPPPPVTGAALGIGLVDEVARAVAVLVAAGVAVPDAGELELTPGVLDAVLLRDAVLLLDALRLLDAGLLDRGEFPEEADAVTDPVGEVFTVGEKTVGVGVGEPEVHAETATGASRVRAAQQTAVSLAPRCVSAIVLRTFMDPPHAPGR